jgi:hypothetical protein
MVVSVRRTRKAIALVGALLGAACVSCASHASPAVHAPAPHDVQALTRGAPLTVVTFFSAHCPCQRAHDGRWKEIFAETSPRGVRFVFIDAEPDASPAFDANQVSIRGYPWTIVSDPDGKWADLFGAAYATDTFVVDAAGLVRFHGGIDSDRSHLTDDARPYLRDALLALLAGAEPPDPEPKVLGCALRRRE